MSPFGSASNKLRAFDRSRGMPRKRIDLIRVTCLTKKSIRNIVELIWDITRRALSAKSPRVTGAAPHKRSIRRAYQIRQKQLRSEVRIH